MVRDRLPRNRLTDFAVRQDDFNCPEERDIQFHSQGVNKQHPLSPLSIEWEPGPSLALTQRTPEIPLRKPDSHYSEARANVFAGLPRKEPPG
jgi:hypothetical protein